METTDTTSQLRYVANAGFDSGGAMILAALLLSVLWALGVCTVLRCSRRWRVVSETSLDVGADRAKTSIIKMDIKALPTTIYRTGSPLGTLADCPICLAEFMEGEKLRVLPDCCHSFHADIIDAWVVYNPSCPSCRHSLLSALCGAGVAWAAGQAEGTGMEVTERKEINATNLVVQTFYSSIDDKTMGASSSLESMVLETGRNVGESKSMIGIIG